MYITWTCFHDGMFLTAEEVLHVNIEPCSRLPPCLYIGSIFICGICSFVQYTCICGQQVA